jgi:hypothetical protein
MLRCIAINASWILIMSGELSALGFHKGRSRLHDEILNRSKWEK